LHSGHVAFFQSAAKYGDLFVAIGSDKTIYELKGRTTVNSEEERLYMIQSLACVHHAFISRGSGMLDFAPALQEMKPDILVVNEDGDLSEKQKLCEALGIEYVVLSRDPHSDLVPRSTTALRDVNRIPYRIDLAGGWLDQPFVSEHHAGSVVTLSIEPTIEFNERSGMASSTRRVAVDLWGPRLPVDNLEKLSRILFCCDNPPGTKYVSGAQDTIGIVYPGLARSDYDGDYWPTEVEHVVDESILHFVEQALYLRPLGPRGAEYDVLKDTHISPEGARALAEAAADCWQAILEQDIQAFGETLRRSFEAQIAMFPSMVNDRVRELIAQYEDQALGWKLSGAGGGGYLILVSDKPIARGLRVHVRRTLE
jgi:glycerol-3-phosphate cytidylyltransferase-like family protein